MTCLTARPSRAGGDLGGDREVMRERPFGWMIEYMRYHGPNMVSCKIVVRLTWTPLVGAYLPPLTLEHLPDLEEALQHFRDPIFPGGVKLDLNKTRSLCSQSVL